jgi:hypothetical protein
MKRKLIWSFMFGILAYTLFWLTVFPVAAKASSETGKPVEPTCTVKRGLIILVEFPDVKHSVERAYVEDRFFTKLNNYVKEMSYNKVCIGGDITKKWYRMPDSISRYKISPRNIEVDKSRVEKLIRDALNAVDSEVDFSRYDFTALFLGAKWDEYGMVGLCGYPGMLGWSAGTAEILKTKSGQKVPGGVAIFCYQAHIGTLFHDIAHILGGVREVKNKFFLVKGKEQVRNVPCLYDHDLQGKPGPVREVFVDSTINMGFWDVMSCHYYKRGQPPPGISSWTKLRLGWLDPAKVREVKPGETWEGMLGPLEDGNSQNLAIKIPLAESTYYLIENRQPLGNFDKILPGSGVLIMYADDTVAECRKGEAPVKLINADPTVPHLEGAAFDLGKKDSFVDKSKGLKIQLVEKIGYNYKIRISAYGR